MFLNAMVAWGLFGAEDVAVTPRLPSCFLISRLDGGRPIHHWARLSKGTREDHAVAVRLLYDTVLARLQERQRELAAVGGKVATWEAVADVFASETEGALAKEGIEATHTTFYATLKEQRDGNAPVFQLFLPAIAAKLELTIEQKVAIGDAVAADWRIPVVADTRPYLLRDADWQKRQYRLHAAVVKVLTPRQRRVLEEATKPGWRKHRPFGSPLMKTRNDPDKLTALHSGRQPLKLDEQTEAKVAAAVERWWKTIAKDGVWLDTAPEATDFDIPEAEERAGQTDEAFRKELREILAPEQLLRMKQLMFAISGLDAEFGMPGDPTPKAGPLGITDEQREASFDKTKAMNAEFRKQKGIAAAKDFNPMYMLHNEMARREVLTPAQAEKLKELAGPPLLDAAAYAMVNKFNLTIDSADGFGRPMAWLGEPPKKK